MFIAEYLIQDVMKQLLLGCENLNRESLERPLQYVGDVVTARKVVSTDAV